MDFARCLPIEILSSIFSRLDLRHIPSVRRVCKFWHEASKHWLLWKTLYIRITQNTVKVHVTDWEKLLHEVIISRERFLLGHCTTTVLKGHTAGVQCVQYSDNMFVTGGRDGTIRKWILDPEVPQGYSLVAVGNIGQEPSRYEYPRFLQFNATRLVFGTSSTLQVWDLESFTKIKQMDLRIWDFQFNEKVIVVGTGNHIRLYDWETLCETQQHNIDMKNAAALQMDDLKVVVGGASGMAAFSLENGLKVWEGIKKHILRFQYHGSIVIVNHDYNNVTIFDMDTDTALYKIVSASSGSTYPTCFQWDEMKLVTGQSDGSIIIYELPNAEELERLKKNPNEKLNRTLGYQKISVGSHSDGVYCLQFFGSKIVTGSGDRTAIVWDFHPAAIRKVLEMQQTSPSPTINNQAKQQGETAPTKEPKKSFLQRLFK